LPTKSLGVNRKVEFTQLPRLIFLAMFGCFGFPYKNNTTFNTWGNRPPSQELKITPVIQKDRYAKEKDIKPNLDPC